MGVCMSTRQWVVGAVVACACLVGAAPALANVTRSNVTVTSPAGTYLIDDEVLNPGEMLTATGTSDGNSSDGDTVDVNCYEAGGFTTLLTGVEVDSLGRFAFEFPLARVANQPCVLRAVPQNDQNDESPASGSPFTGPTLLVDGNQHTTTGSGVLEDYFLNAAQKQGGFDYGSLGGCGIADSFVYDLATLADKTLEFCNAFFGPGNGDGNPGHLAPTRSELQVDGVDAYLPGNAGGLWSDGVANSADNPGFPTLSYQYSIDPGTGNLVLDETDQVVECSPQPRTYPATEPSCSSFVPAGVLIKVHIAQTHDGRLVADTQSFSSADGKSHALDLLEDNQFFNPNLDGQMNFPWTGTGFQPYTTLGQAIAGPSRSGPGSFFVNGSVSALGPLGSVTFSNPPDSLHVISPTNDRNQEHSWFDLHYTRTVPAAGSVALGFTYGTSFTENDVVADASAAEGAYRPAISIQSVTPVVPSAQPQFTVSGVASDATGLTSVTVNGQQASVGPGGAWSAVVPVSQGINPITAAASNVFGNTAQAQDSVIYVKPGPGSPGTATGGGAPVIGFVHQVHSRWRVSGRAQRGEAPVGSGFSFTLTEAARVTLRFTEQVAGRRVAARCVAPSRANRHRAACRRTVTVGTIGLAGHSGLNRVGFDGRLGGGRKLGPGRYTLTITALDPSSGAVSTAKRLSFTIVK
jgi:hypothetical protein